MVIVGVVLLLQGLCALVFGAGSLFSSSYDSGFTLFILVFPRFLTILRRNE